MEPAMTSINTNLSSYYQLSNALTGQQDNSSSGSNQSATDTSGTSLTQSLISALDAASNGGSSSDNNDSAYSLSLSPQAQQLLGNGSSSSSSSDFTLTNVQQNTIEGILQQYASQPLTQDTYDQIQQALQKAGLGADQLMAQDEITNGASPQTLI